MPDRLTSASKFLSLILRHQPQAIGLTLDANGWVALDELIEKANAHGKKLDEALIREVVTRNDKQRFSLDEAQRRIRANQGHSVKIELGLLAVTPPEVLYHGTATRFLESIRRHGLKPMQRQQVHLSPDAATAFQIGTRHGFPAVLRIRALALAETGQAFYRSENGVWLTARVPAQFIDFGMGR